MFRVSDLRNKDIINIIDGKKLGLIKDIELDLTEGKIQSLILPCDNKMWGFFNHREDITIDWRQIKKIGADVILVEIYNMLPPAQSNEETQEE